MRQKPERMVVALGGNALLRHGDRGTAVEQEAHSLAAMEALVPLLTSECQVVITHGNGPIVGNILIRHQRARAVIPPMPLDVCGAESQGNIGYLLERALVQALQRQGINRSVATVLSLVEVDPHDLALTHPTKPIGPFLSEAEAQKLSRSVPVAHDSDRGGFVASFLLKPIPLCSPTDREVVEGWDDRLQEQSFREGNYFVGGQIVRGVSDFLPSTGRNDAGARRLG